MTTVQIDPHDIIEDYVRNYQAALDAHRESTLYGLQFDLRLAGEHYRRMGVMLAPFKDMSKLNTPYVEWIKVVRGFLGHDECEESLAEDYEQGETVLGACCCMF